MFTKNLLGNILMGENLAQGGNRKLWAECLLSLLKKNS